MTDRTPHGPEEPLLVDAPTRLLVGGLRQGFRLEARDSVAVRVDVAEDAWRVREPLECGAWRLRRDRRGFTLSDDSGAEIGRSSRIPGVGPGEGPVWILRDDGALFRLSPRGPRDCRYELSGWETCGPYFEARPESLGWKIAPTAAGTGLQAVEPLLILLSAEILDADSADGEDGAVDGDA